MMPSRSLVLLVVGLAACGEAAGNQDTPKVERAKVVPSATPMADEPAAQPVVAKPKDATKGDQQDEEWVPAEFKAGMARWKDIGVYVDGKPIGFLSWGELPLALPPTWVKDKVSANKRPGTNEPGWRWVQQRFYKFTDYFKAVGIDVRKIKEVHIYGPKLSQTFIASGKDMQSPLADKLMFRFGANTYGKPIPVIPYKFGNERHGDKISAVMVYITKKPPVLVRNEGLELDGVPQLGVPYFGDPIRGGIRIYLDDKLAAIIKRQELDPKKADKGPNGELNYKLADVLTAQGVDVKKVVEGWVIRDERRQEKFPASELATMTFAASSQAKGGVLLGDKKIRANAIALHSHPIKPEQIPQPTPDDD